MTASKEIDELLREAIEVNASDIHLQAAQPLFCYYHG